MASGEAGTPVRARREPGTRQRRLSRERIAAAALDIADREGFDAVSMRRLAADLDAGTMSLYHHVRTKADLVALMDDALMAEALLAEGEMPPGWRAALTLIARRTWALLVRHSWALGAFQESQFGPNAMRHFEQSLAAVDGTGLDPGERLELLALVDGYVFGSALHAGESLRRAALACADPEAARAAVEAGVARLRTGAFPHIEALFGGGGPGHAGAGFAGPPLGAAGPPMELEALRDQFDRGLQAVLDGAHARMGLPADAPASPWARAPGAAPAPGEP
jgi:AcrR family transcriptional regulator